MYVAISYANFLANHSSGRLPWILQQTRHFKQPSNQRLKSAKEKCLLFLNYDYFWFKKTL